MADPRDITLRIPDPEDFDMDVPPVYAPVRLNVVDFGVEWLQCVLAHCAQDDHDAAQCDRLAVSGAQMLSGLLEARGAYYHGDHMRVLVEQIVWHLGGRWVNRSAELEARLAQLDAVRTPDNADFVDALLAVCRARLARHKEAKQQPAAAGDPTSVGRAPAEDHDGDPGWEF